MTPKKFIKLFTSVYRILHEHGHFYVAIARAQSPSQLHFYVDKDHTEIAITVEKTRIPPSTTSSPTITEAEEDPLNGMRAQKPNDDHTNDTETLRPASQTYLILITKTTNRNRHRPLDIRLHTLQSLFRPNVLSFLFFFFEALGGTFDRTPRNIYDWAVEKSLNRIS